MMSDELNVISDEEKSRSSISKVYVTAGAVGSCILVLILASAIAIGSQGGSSRDEVFGSSISNNAGACRSHACSMLGDRMNATVNAAEQPCANFYRFVCSGRQKNSNLTQDASETGFGEKWVTETLRDSYYKVESNPRIPFKGQTEAQKYLTFYLSCYHSLAPGSRSVKSLKRFLQYFNFPWPKVRVNTHRAFDLLIRMELDFNIGSFFRFGISLKRKNAWDFTLKPPKVTKFLYSPTRKDNYRSYLDKVVKMMGGSLKHGSTADMIAKMEADLFELAVIEKKQRVHIKNLALLTHVVTPDVWMDTFSKYFILSKFLGNHTMVITSPEYFRRLFSSLSKKEGSLYLGWRLVRFGGCFTHEMRALEESFHLTADSCSRAIADPRDFCRAYASKMMLSQFMAFVTESLTNRQEVSAVATIVENVQREIIKGISLNPSLDNATKTTALTKLNSIRHVLPAIGERSGNDSPFTIPDLGADFLENWVRVVPRAGYPARDYQIQEALKHTYEDHIHYDAYSNHLYVPVGSMKPPFHSPDLPASTTYALVGRVIAHELLHSLDAQGRDTDDRGRSVHWWSEEFTEVHNARSSCYVRLYELTSNYTNNTTQEDVIDSAAVRYAYAAFKAALPRDKVSNTLGGLEPFNAEQTFFITYCYRFCENESGQADQHGGRTVGYPEGEYRCNVPLMNMEDFAHAFSCHPKDAMNPPQKCYLW